MDKPTTWVRVAGNATKVKAGSPYGWRCYIEGNPDEIALKGWFIRGRASEQNAIQGFTAAGDVHGIVAWIDYFGNYEIRDDVLYINLHTPTTPPPSYQAQH